MLLSELRTKKVVSLTEARTLGTVNGVYIDRETYKVKYLSLYGDMSICPVDEIYGKADILTVENALPSTAERARLWLYDNEVDVYNVRGEYIGKSVDIEINTKRKVPCFLTDNKPVKIKNVVASSAEMIIIDPHPNKVRSPLGTLLLKGSEEYSPEASVISEATHSPDRSDGSDYSFLLGRRLNYEVADISRSFVLMAGTLITERVISNARKAGKIADLVTKSS